MKRMILLTTALALVAFGCSSDKNKDTAEAAIAQVNASSTGGGLDKDHAMAEARRASMNSPAVDTSQLRLAPSWQLVDLAGNAVTNADFAGKIMILDFWATWCGPCKMEIPHFKELQATYKDQGLEIVGVALDREGPAKVAPFVKSAALNYHTVIGNQKIVSDYGPISGIPTTFVISQDGKIFKRYVGYRPKEVFEKDIKTLLGPDNVDS